MVRLTRRNGREVFLNADLIESIEQTPDTIVTLVDGKQYLVTESAEEVVEAFTLFRASVLTLMHAATSGLDVPGLEDAHGGPGAGERP